MWTKALELLPQIVALVVLLSLQTWWQRRTGSRAMESTVASLRTAIKVASDTAEAGFVRMDRSLDGMGHRIDLVEANMAGLAKSVDGLHARELTRLEDDAKATRRRRR